MQSTGQTSMQASQPVQLSARTTASSLGSFLRALPAPLAMRSVLYSGNRNDIVCSILRDGGTADQAKRGRGVTLPARRGVSFDLEDTFDLDGDVAGQGDQADGAACADAGVLAEDLGHQFGKAVDDGGVLPELRGAVDHAERLDQALDLVQRPELVAHGRQD